jgi:hypothetical protein
MKLHLGRNNRLQCLARRISFTDSDSIRLEREDPEPPPGCRKHREALATAELDSCNGFFNNYRAYILNSFGEHPPLRHCLCVKTLSSSFDAHLVRSDDNGAAILLSVVPIYCGGAMNSCSPGPVLSFSLPAASFDPFKHQFDPETIT